MPKFILSGLLIFLLSTPLVVASFTPISALAATTDSSYKGEESGEGMVIGANAQEYFGPYCFESPSDFPRTVANGSNSDPDKVRGTCRKIQTTTVVSIDAAIQNDYYLGFHEPICYGDGFGRHQIITTCIDRAQYSEFITLHGRSSLEYDTSYFYDRSDRSESSISNWRQIHPQFMGIETDPAQVALFERSFFDKKLEGFTFPQGSDSTVLIAVLNKAEIDSSYRKYGKDMDYVLGYRYEAIASTTGPVDRLMGIAYFQNEDGTRPPNDHWLKTFNFQEYGKHIFGPHQNGLRESTYVPIERSGNMLTADSLKITVVADDTDRVPVVPSSSLVKGIKNYWMYAKKNGKLVLAWQKTEYTLDNGIVKTITPADKNVTAAMLFGTSATPAATTTAPTPAAPAKKGFFEALFDWLFGWL